MSSEKRICKSCDVTFTIEPDDFSFYEKMGVPPPTWCPQCRLRRRLMWRNDRDYYRRACDLCKRNIIALYPSDAPFPVRCVKCWWSDAWDPFQYGQRYDPSRPFFEQCNEIFEKIPAIAMQNDDGVGSVNCEYTNDWWYSKNCYSAVAGWHDENVMYAAHIEHSKEIMDSLHVHHVEWLYECLASTKCYRCAYCTFCHDCNDCFLSYDLRGCSNCVMCVGLRNKKYCILNQQYSKEEYEVKLKELKLGSRTSIEKHRKTFEDFAKKFPRRYAQILKSVNATGDMLINCKNTRDCYFNNSLENCRFITIGDGGKETYDCLITGQLELCYEGVVPDHSYHCMGTIYSVRSREVFYSWNCPGAEHLMGCAGIKKGSHVILNTQYTESEYETLKAKVVADMKRRGEWGEFFPESMSPFAYNETLAYDIAPLSRDEAIAQGFRWKEPRERDYKITLPAEKIPDTIAEVGDNITNEVIGCLHGGSCNEKCTTAFRIVPDELRFYRAMHIPPPQLCPNCRHYARIATRSPMRLWKRDCMCGTTNSKEQRAYRNTAPHSHGEKPCPNEFETTFAPNRTEIIYCEDCYNAEVA
ncbi:MAG: hypothetical protein HYW65_03840 [Candidatus Liptonbacteria bacterium]|nr:hypothetical protein [Candidatus Liptonbacteria bacterium]